MPKYKVNTMEKWNKLSIWMRENGFTLWQMQYGIHCPEGFYTWFMKPGMEDIEIHTYNEEIQEAIIGFNNIYKKLI